MAQDDKDDFMELLRLQLSEMDLLESMFPNELHVDDPSVIADINNYVDGKTTTLPNRLDFVLDVEIDSRVTFHLSCSLPHTYPTSEPDVYVRSQQLDREQQRCLNEDLSAYVKELDRGELCAYAIVQWLRDNVDRYVAVKSDSSPEENCLEERDKKEDDSFARYWIYSHHIYNKEKRRDILDFAKELNITGFCMPGKPGIICAEGLASNCADFWHKVKQMSWKKIMCKMKEIEAVGSRNPDQLRRFSKFEEIAFEVRRGPGREYHMDMGEFLQYLENHDSGYVFKDYFGVDGRLKSYDR